MLDVLFPFRGQGSAERDFTAADIARDRGILLGSDSSGCWLHDSVPLQTDGKPICLFDMTNRRLVHAFHRHRSQPF